MKTQSNRLTFSQQFFIATMLFGLFFGAGNLIFPIFLGSQAGRNVWPAIVGLLITGVGIPLLGVAAQGISRSNGLQEMAGRVSSRYSIFFTCALYLTIGPFFAIPRCASTSFTVGIEPLLGEDVNATVLLAAFSCVFFAAVLFFSLRPGKILTWVGKLLTPLFLLVLAILGSCVYGISKKPADLPQVSYGNWLRDDADLLTDETEASLRQYDQSWDSDYRAIIAVATLDTLNGWTYEKAAAELGSQWGLGGNDMLLLLVKDSDYYVALGDNVLDAMTDTYQAGLQGAVEAPYYQGDYDAAALAFFRQADVFYAQTLGRQQSGGSYSDYEDNGAWQGNDSGSVAAVERELDPGFGYREHERVDKRYHLVFKTGQDISRFYRADEGFVQVNLVYGTSPD